MKVTHIAHATQEAERFLAAVKLWRAKKILVLPEGERLRALRDEMSQLVWSGPEQAAVRRASLDLSKALATMRQDV